MQEWDGWVTVYAQLLKIYALYQLCLSLPIALYFLPQILYSHTLIFGNKLFWRGEPGWLSHQSMRLLISGS